MKEGVLKMRGRRNRGCGDEEGNFKIGLGNDLILNINLIITTQDSYEVHRR